MVTDTERTDTNPLIKHVLTGGKFPDKFINRCRIAAEQGDVEMQTFLGAIYTVGIGVEKDMEQARYWWGKAAKQNNPDAIAVMEEMFGVSYGDK